MPKRSRKRPKTRTDAVQKELRVVHESAGQQLSPDEQERATVSRIISEMGRKRGRGGAKRR